MVTYPVCQAEDAAGTECATSLRELGDSINAAMQRRMAKASERLQVMNPVVPDNPTFDYEHPALIQVIYLSEPAAFNTRWGWGVCYTRPCILFQVSFLPLGVSAFMELDDICKNSRVLSL